MFRTTDIALIVVMLAAAGFTYKTKHDAENRRAEISQIEQKIMIEDDSIDVLKADWALLTQPSRLQRLAERYSEQLGLQSTEPWQIATLSDLPVKPIEIDDILREAGMEPAAPTSPAPAAAPPPAIPLASNQAAIPVPTFRAALQ